MCKAPDKSKITTFLRQCLTSTSAKADLSTLYSPSDLSVEQVELEDMRTYRVYARCNLPHGVCPYCDREPLLPIRQIAHIVDKSIRKEKMVHAEVALVEKMMSYGWFRDIYNAASSFHATIMGNDVDEPDSWLDSYGKSPIKELRSFAYGIRMDLKAVRNAITLDTSNGIVEGFVNKLKAVKRVMFGRASLDLLKRKMVFSDLCFN